MKATLTINDDIVEVDADENTPLLWVLREQRQFTGTKYGCGVGVCGSCTVLVDGQALRSCKAPVSMFDQSQRITTIESTALASQRALIKAWTDLSVSQCGYCQPGMIMSATALLEKNQSPTDAEIDAGISNICRCGTYQLVRAAIKRASEDLQNG
ncbi:MAG: (2Fe-2S)-binding protein [Gammaproteobacteria bacterium]